MMGVISQHNIKISQYQDFTISSFHNVKICRILVRYKDYVDVCSKDMPTLAPQLSRHPKGIREEEQFWLEKGRNRVSGNDRVPGGEEPHKLRGSMKSQKERVRPRAGKDRQRLRQHQSHLRRRRTADCGCVWTTELSIEPWVVLATGPGNPPAVRVWTAKMGRFGSRTIQKPDLQTLGGPNPDLYPSTRGLRRVWQDRSVPISGSAFQVSHLWSHSDMRLLIVKYWPWYVRVRFRRISRLDVQNKNTQAPNYILKMSVNRASTIFGLASSVIWVLRDHKHP